MYKTVFIILIAFYSFPLKAQSDLDSLWTIWKDDAQADTSRLKALDKFIWDGYLFSQPDSAFYFGGLEYDFAESKGIKKHMAYAIITQGVSFEARADYPKALSYYQRSLKICEGIADKSGVATSLNNIGTIYLYQRDFAKALDYYQRSLELREQTKEKIGIAQCLANIGMAYDDQSDAPKALDFYNRGLKIFEEIGDNSGIANSLNNTGVIYEDMGDYPKALDYYRRSLKTYEASADKAGMANALNNIGGVHQKQRDYRTASNECQKGLELAQGFGAVLEQRDACKCLYAAYKAMGNDPKALAYREQMASLDDSLNAVETNKKLQQMEFEKVLLADSLKQEKEKAGVQLAHQKEVAQKDMVRNMLLGGGLLFVILSVGFFNRWRYVKHSRDVISVERDRSERLLLNILPAEIAEELKAKGRADARDFELVTILFTDFKGFTEASAKLSAQELVSEINACFEFFDGIMGKYAIEKIKTIGDAYMCAGGLPVPSADSPMNTIRAALDMQDFMKIRKSERDLLGLPAFEMRCGIHTGPVVAGIVGVKKFAYDIWGDTVNTASRMESSGEVGQVNISGSTYALTKDDPGFTFTSRGKVQAKGKGEMEMYFVRRSLGNG